MKAKQLTTILTFIHIAILLFLISNIYKDNVFQIISEHSSKGFFEKLIVLIVYSFIVGTIFYINKYVLYPLFVNIFVNKHDNISSIFFNFITITIVVTGVPSLLILSFTHVRSTTYFVASTMFIFFLLKSIVDTVIYKSNMFER